MLKVTQTHIKTALLMSIDIKSAFKNWSKMHTCILFSLIIIIIIPF